LQRLQDISQEDAITEGCLNAVPFLEKESNGDLNAIGETAQQVQSRLRWPQRNFQKRYAITDWHASPYVWAVTHKRVES